MSRRRREQAILDITGNGVVRTQSELVEALLDQLWREDRFVALRLPEVEYLVQEQFDLLQDQLQTYKLLFAAPYLELAERAAEQISTALQQGVEPVSIAALGDHEDADFVFARCADLQDAQYQLPRVDVIGVVTYLDPGALPVISRMLDTQTLGLVTRRPDAIAALMNAVRLETGFSGQIMAASLEEAKTEHREPSEAPGKPAAVEWEEEDATDVLFELASFYEEQDRLDEAMGAGVLRRAGVDIDRRGPQPGEDRLGHDDVGQKADQPRPVPSRTGGKVEARQVRHPEGLELRVELRRVTAEGLALGLSTEKDDTAVPAHAI